VLLALRADLRPRAKAGAMNEKIDRLLGLIVVLCRAVIVFTTRGP